MYYVYGIQAIGQPAGVVKIGYAAKPMNRLKALEPGAFGERLQIIFQVLAGTTKAEGRKLERIYHFEFAVLRINHEQFRFDPRMLTWTPNGARRVYAETGSPASNTVPAVSLTAGDVSIFQPIPIRRERYALRLPNPGDLTVAVTVQKIIQHGTLQHAAIRHDTTQFNFMKGNVK